MVGKRIVIISVAVLVLLVASFFVGTLYSPPRELATKDLGQGLRSDVIFPTEVAVSQPKLLDRMVIYNARISLETSDTQSVLDKIAALIESYGGYVAGSSRAYDMAEITVRVPKDKFHVAVRQIETYGKVLNEQTSSEDVTERFVDLKARLGNLQRQEQRLREILSLAKTVDKVLQVEKEIERVRGEIESLQGQINYLEHNATLYLISISLTAPAPPFTAPGMNWNETFETALTGLFVVLRGLIILAVALLPFILIGLPAYYVYKRRKPS